MNYKLREFNKLASAFFFIFYELNELADAFLLMNYELR